MADSVDWGVLQIQKKLSVFESEVVDKERDQENRKSDLVPLMKKSQLWFMHTTDVKSTDPIFDEELCKLSGSAAISYREPRYLSIEPFM